MVTVRGPEGSSSNPERGPERQKFNPEAQKNRRIDQAQKLTRYYAEQLSREFQTFQQLYNNPRLLQRTFRDGRTPEQHLQMSNRTLQLRARRIPGYPLATIDMSKGFPALVFFSGGNAQPGREPNAGVGKVTIAKPTPKPEAKPQQEKPNPEPRPEPKPAPKPQPKPEPPKEKEARPTDGASFAKASLEMRNDLTLVKEMIKLDPTLIRHSPEGSRNAEFVLGLLSTRPFSLKATDILKNIAPELRQNPAFAIAAIDKGIRLNQFPDLQNDRSVVEAAVKKSGSNLAHAVDIFKKDKDIVLLAVQKDPSAFQYADGDKAFALEIFEKEPRILEYANVLFKNNEDMAQVKELILKAIKADNKIRRDNVPEDLRKDVDVALAIADYDQDALWDIYFTLDAKVEVATLAVQRKPLNLLSDKFPKKYNKNVNLVTAALESAIAQKLPKEDLQKMLDWADPKIHQEVLKNEAISKALGKTVPEVPKDKPEPPKPKEEKPKDISVDPKLGAGRVGIEKAAAVLKDPAQKDKHAEIKEQLKQLRKNEMRKPGTEVYIPVPGEGIEKGVVENRGEKLFVVNKLEQWELAFNPDLKAPDPNAVECWLSYELEEKGGAWDIKEVCPKNPSAECVVRLQQILKNDTEKLATMSDADMRTYFGDLRKAKTYLQQARGSGNCYAIAGYSALVNNDYIEGLLRTSCKILKDANDKPVGMQIRLPLGDPQAQPQDVSFEEACGVQTDPDVRYFKKRGEIVILRPGQHHPNEELLPGKTLAPITSAKGDSAVGWQCIEHLVTKKYYGGSRALRGEGGFAERSLEQLVHGSESASSTILGEPGKNLANSGQEHDVLNFCKRYTNGKTVATCGTPSFTQIVKNETFYRNHAYSILAVNKAVDGDDVKVRGILVSESNHPEKTIFLTYEEFLEAFGTVRAVTLKYDELFQHKPKA